MPRPNRDAEYLWRLKDRPQRRTSKRWGQRSPQEAGAALGLLALAFLAFLLYGWGSLAV